jgi:tetratricopeptide (TPR) repeat protein
MSATSSYSRRCERTRFPADSSAGDDVNKRLFVGSPCSATDAGPTLDLVDSLSRHSVTQPLYLNTSLVVGRGQARSATSQCQVACGSVLVTTVLHEFLAGAYAHLGMFAESIDFHTRCLEEAQRHGDVRGEMCALKRLGAAHSFLRQHEQALAFLDRLLALLESNRAQGICRFADVLDATSQLGEWLCKTAALVESSVREGQPNTHCSIFTQTFYRLGLVCSGLLQTSHFALYSLSKKAGMLPEQQQCLKQPSAPGGKKDQVFEALHAFQRAI